uniref:Uncharacterized protein n=1 Tax=Ditylenchus dipsaci TaxID=166011 RepID=A0A915EHI6_9BILA
MAEIIDLRDKSLLSLEARDLLGNILTFIWSCFLQLFKFVKMWVEQRRRPFLRKLLVANGQTDSKQNEHETFCGKYSECHARARKEFEKCVGGAMQMVIARHLNMEKLFTSNVTAENERSLAEKCEHEMADNISEDIRILYERIDQFTARCTSEVNKGSFALDQTQAFICKAVQGEIEHKH